jgi:hypothetical protein
MVMKVERYPPDTGWYAAVYLDEQEWPLIDSDGHWLDRPIRLWVQEHIAGKHFFTFAGMILFESESDLTQFVLTWR